MGQHSLLELAHVLGRGVHPRDEVVTRKSILLVLVGHGITRWLAALQFLVVLKLGPVEAHVRQQRSGHTGEHARCVVVQKGLDPGRTSGMAFEQSAHVVDIPVEHDPILVGTLLDVLVRVHRPLPAQEDGDETEDAHEEAGSDEHHEADGHLLAPRLLRLRVLLPNALVRDGKRHATAEVVPPHGAFVVIRLLDGDGTRLLGTLEGTSVAALVAATVTRLVIVAGAGVVIELVPHGGGEGAASDGAAVARPATVVAVLVGDALAVFPSLGAAARVVAGLFRPSRLLALGVVTRIGVIAVGGVAFRPTGRLDAGRATAFRNTAHLVVDLGGRIRSRVVIVRPRSVLPSVGIVGAELVGHAIGIVTAATSSSSSSSSLGSTRARTSRADRSRIRIAGAEPAPALLIAHGIDAVTTAVVVTAATPPGGTAAATHSVVVLIISAVFVAFAVAGDVVDHFHEAGRVAGAVVVVDVIIAIASGGALR
mmetsp:Transcript_24728/g.47358  ORF Transcript_24728/g.47358 Transcript_24728/m.47358 type:complete len:481 (-) Transcript_24728:514-1956(-)